MKHILFIMTSLEGGGAEKSLIEILNRIDYTRYKVSLCLLFKVGIYLNDIPKEVRVISIFQNYSSRLYQQAYYYYRIHQKTDFLAFCIKRKIKSHYDVIISFMEGLPLLFHSFITNRGKYNITWVHCDLYTFHYSLKCFTEKITERGCYELMNKIVFVSQIAKLNFNKLYSINVSTEYIYNMVDTTAIEKIKTKTGIPKTVFTIIAIGSFYPVKAFDRLIRVARILKDNKYSFCIQILGEGILKEPYEKLSIELGVRNEIKFLGFKKPVYPYLKQSDLLISTSISEGMSYVIAEAFVSGIPVVATRTAGAIELLDNGKYGILTEHDDVSIYNGITSLMNNTELRKEYKNKSAERAKFFNVEQTMQKFYDLIERK